MVLVSSETVGFVRWRKKEVRVAAMDGGREHETEMLSGRSYRGNLEGTKNLWWKMGFWFSRICLLLQILSSFTPLCGANSNGHDYAFVVASQL